MIINKTKLIWAVFLLVCFNVNATLITLETRTIDTAVNTSDFANSWLSQGTSITSIEPTEFTLFKSGRNSFTHLKIDLSLEKNNVNWVFELGLDAGLGAAFYLDSQLVSSRTDDLWWQHNWNHSDVFSVSLNNLTPNNTVLDIYWAERCCNGASSIRFKDASQPWKTLSVDNLVAASVPEPTTVMILGLGILALVRRLWK